MNAQQFLAEFGHVANAPGGINRLRELILQLAVTGGLVSIESPVVDAQFLERILQQKRNHSEKKKVIPKQAPVALGVVRSPSHWNVCRLGDIALTITGGGTPSKNHSEYWNGDIPWASVKDLKDFQYLEKTEDRITEEGLRNSSANLIPPGRVIVCTRMGLGKVAINRVAMAINQDLKALELSDEINPTFFLLVYKTREVRGAGMTVAGIKQDDLLALPVAIPPREEQSRIVAKVDELMTLCDQLEKQQQERRKLQNTLRQSTLQALASAQSPHELRTSWERLQANFGRLFSEPADVDELRRTIFDLAIEGHISQQAASDGTARELLDKIAEIRNATGKHTYKALALDPEAAGQTFPALPKSWTWCRLGDLGVIKTGKTPSTANPKNYGGMIPFIGPGQITPNGEIIGSEKSLSMEGEALGVIADIGDIMMVCIGGSIGKSCIVQQRVAINQQINLISPILVSSDYIHLVMRSRVFQYFVLSESKGSATPIISGAKWKSLPVPLPPLPEQLRINERANKLIQICEYFESQLKCTVQTARRMANATIASLTGFTQNEQKDTAVKAP